MNKMVEIKCEVDDMIESKAFVQQEIQKNYMEKSNQCTICHRNFILKNQLEMHMLTHEFKEKKRPFKCEVCEKGYLTEKYLEIHQYTHSDTKPYTCQLCEKGYVRKAKLGRHLLKVHNVKQEILERHDIMLPLGAKISNDTTCIKCGKEFMNLKLLNAHMRMECGDVKSFQCNIENVSLVFDNNNNSTVKIMDSPKTRHRKIPKVYAPSKAKILKMKEKTGLEWQCNQCPKSFRSKSEIRHHIKMHDQVRPHKCELCSKDFPKKVQLKLHMKTHIPAEVNTIPMPDINKKASVILNCEDKVFVTNFAEKHIKLEPSLRDANFEKENHVGGFPLPNSCTKKSLECEVCGADFRNKSFLKLHMKTHQKV